MIGLLGSHRTGKTTLARALSERMGIPFVQTGVTATYNRIGLDPAVHYPLDVRLYIQNEILTDLKTLYAQAPVGGFVTDRTPLDLAMYTLADVVRDAPIGQEQMVLDYVGRCFDVTNRYLSIVVLVQPGIELVPAPGKAALNRAYIEHLNAIASGLLVDKRNATQYCAIPRFVTNLDDRIEAVQCVVDRVIGKVGESLEDAVMH